jgi:EAL domain-containing protein (putative c-di-GMP-specific phosphodiesterase class I)
MELDGLHLIVRAQSGVVQLDVPGRSPADVLRCADIALGRARRDQDGVAEYRSERDVSGPRNLELIAELRTALANEAVELHLQPKVALSDGRVESCEALLRWTHPRFGRIEADRAIAVAEAGRMMRELSLWVVRTALRHAAALRSIGVRVPVAVNVSVQNLVDEGFPEAVAALLKEHGAEVGELRLEITETVLMRDPERALPVICRLADMGIALDVDDFGTGYSSLADLRMLPLAELKVDRSFVGGMLRRREDEIVVRSTVGMAHGLDLRVVAEGVEDAATLARLAELGCDAAQGHHIARPMPLEALQAWLRDRGGQPARA